MNGRSMIRSRAQNLKHKINLSGERAIEMVTLDLMDMVPFPGFTN